MQASEIRELLRWIKEDVISFGGGLPDPSVFPSKEEWEECARYVESKKDKAFQYGKTEGLDELKVALAKFSAKTGITADPEEILITTGSQQALDATARVFLDEEDTVIVELPTYIAALQAFSVCKPSYVGVPLDLDGMRTDILEEKLRELKERGVRPKFLYTVPLCQNPAGVSLSLDRKKHLLELASQYDLLVVEDDPYGHIVFDPVDTTRLKALDREGRVVYMSTFSKIFAPGLRVGWMVASKEIIEQYSLAKQAMDLCTSMMAQHIASYAIESGMIERRLPMIKSLYREKRDVMLSALKEHMPEGVVWSKPIGGMFVFTWLDVAVNTKEVLFDVIRNFKIAYVPGSSFFVDGTGWNTMRLSFSYPPIPQIEEGVRRLAKAVEWCYERKGIL